MNCQEQKKMWSYLDSLLPPDQSIHFQKHLKECESCSERYTYNLNQLEEVQKFIPQSEGIGKVLKSLQNEIKANERELRAVLESGSTSLEASFRRLLRHIEKEVASTLFSKEMVKLYLVSLIVIFTAKMIF